MQNEWIDEDEIDVKDIFYTIGKYKYSIILITILTTLLATVFAYYKSNIYEAKTSIQINTDNKAKIDGNDILQNALSGGGGSSSIDTEMALFKSRFLILEAMKRVDLVTHIWEVNKFKKKIELYLDAPIEVDIKKGKDYLFTLKPINDNTYELEVKGESKNGIKFEDKREGKYGKVLKHTHYELTINKIGKLNIGGEYKFVVYEPNYYAENTVRDNLSVSQIGKKTDIVDVKYSDTVPLRAKQFVNELANAYMKQNIEIKTKEATQTLKFVNKQLAIIESNLKLSEKKIEEFKTKAKTVDVSMTAEQLSKTLSEYESKVGILNMQISILKTLLNKVKKGIGLDTLTVVGLDIDSANGISELIKNLQQAMLEKKALLGEYTNAHPEVQKISTRITNLKRIIKQSLANTLRGLEQKKQLLTTQMSKYQKQLSKLPKIQQNYLGLERKFTFNEKFYTYLLQKRTETEIKKAATVSQNRIVDRALMPEAPVKPNRKLIVAVGFVLGIILGLALAFVRNFINNTISSIEDIERESEVPVVASIPKYRVANKDKRELVVLKKPKSSVAESMRTLRSNLQFMTKGNGSKVITITSTVAGEGKTFISSNLAAVIQMLDKRVIILNFDLRKPTLHTVFDLPNTKGLSGYLSGHLESDEIIMHTKIKNLDIISAGTVPPNPSELIISDRTTQLIDKLKKEYDYIILDTPPVGLVSDAKALIASSDVVLYVMRADYSKKEFIKTVNKTYKNSDIKSMGIILNGVDATRGYGGYGYYEDK